MIAWCMIVWLMIMMMMHDTWLNILSNVHISLFWLLLYCAFCFGNVNICFLIPIKPFELNNVFGHHLNLVSAMIFVSKEMRAIRTRPGSNKFYNKLKYWLECFTVNKVFHNNITTACCTLFMETTAHLNFD